ncbi:hypothetical protein DRN69_02510 [Candidatus Pacearchaeota archaeon]|nr:MAG: hypothetical protein DRN69_02510 [Candidatus Pacearchaeota archaeon]
MTEKKYILISMEDERAKKIADILGNKTCRKIIDYLSNVKEASEKDISSALNIPINTTEYNLKKLLNSELIKKTKNFFWSKKGKKIIMYKLSNKSIVIFPKAKKISYQIKSILGVAIVSGFVALVIRQLSIASKNKQEIIQVAEQRAISESANFIVKEGDFFFAQPIPAWIWFLSGALVAIALFLIINWRDYINERR